MAAETIVISTLSIVDILKFSKIWHSTEVSVEIVFLLFAVRSCTDKRNAKRMRGKGKKGKNKNTPLSIMCQKYWIDISDISQTVGKSGDNWPPLIELYEMTLARLIKLFLHAHFSSIAFIRKEKCRKIGPKQMNETAKFSSNILSFMYTLINIFHVKINNTN